MVVGVGWRQMPPSMHLPICMQVHKNKCGGGGGGGGASAPVHAPPPFFMPDHKNNCSHLTEAKVAIQQ